MSENRGIYDKKINWYVLLDWSGESRTFVKLIFHARFLRALWVKSSGHTLRFSRTERTFPSSRLARKREFHPLRFGQQITHETFAEFSEARDPTTLNNFPIAEVVNGQALQWKKASNGERIKYLQKLHFYFSHLNAYFWNCRDIQSKETQNEI